MKNWILISVVSLAAVITLWITAHQRFNVVSSHELPVYGTDPLMHTMYVGSDNEYHHFQLQNGKQGSLARVPVEDAEIRPEPFPLDSGRRQIVVSATEGEIRLLSLPPSN